jgi:ferredoxin-type protein NapH
MGSLQKEDINISYQILNCITCRQCEATCPKSAISYGLGKSGWQNESINQPERPTLIEEV